MAPLRQQSSSNNLKEILKAPEAAAYLGVCRRQFDRIYKDLGIPVIYISERAPRFRRVDIDRALERLAQGGAA